MYIGAMTRYPSPWHGPGAGSGSSQIRMSWRARWGLELGAVRGGGGSGPPLPGPVEQQALGAGE